MYCVCVVSLHIDSTESMMTEIQNWGCLIVVSINELSNDVLKSQSHFCQKLQSTKGYNIVFMILGQKSTDVKMDTSG